MPKIKKQEEEMEELEDEEGQFEEDELEEPEPESAPVKRKVKKKAPVPPIEPKRRFGVVPAQPLRLIDTESEEIVGEGEDLIATTLADILERLERIENSVGSMLEG